MPDGSRFVVAETPHEQLAALKAKLPQEGSRLQQAGQSGGFTAAGDVVIEVTEQTFYSEVVQRSHTKPVIVYWWAKWCGPCKQLGPALEEFAAEADGQWILAKVDIDANPQLKATLEVQEIPMVAAVVGGQIVDGFQGAMRESLLWRWLSRVMATAAESGLQVDYESDEPLTGRRDDNSALPAAYGQPAIPGQPSQRRETGTASLDVLVGQLDGLTGLAPVKAEVRQLIDMVRAEQMRRAAGWR